MTKRKTDQHQTDFVPHGSDQHAALLGLRKGEDGEWVLDDPTIYGPAARPEFLEHVLRQKVAALNTPPEIPDNAPDMDIPPDQRGRYSRFEMPNE
jgi:hypothetical protein